jgi:hypothetical protein
MEKGKKPAVENKTIAVLNDKYANNMKENDICAKHSISPRDLFEIEKAFIDKYQNDNQVLSRSNQVLSNMNASAESDLKVMKERYLVLLKKYQSSRSQIKTLEETVDKYEFEQIIESVSKAQKQREDILKPPEPAEPKESDGAGPPVEESKKEEPVVEKKL